MPRRHLAWAVLATAVSACATATFRISPEAQLKAEEQANLADMAASGLQGTWITSTWRGGICHWSRQDPTIAVCYTATRYSERQPWHSITQRYRRDEGGDWRMLPP